MRIDQLLAQVPPTISFELTPETDEVRQGELEQSISELEQLRPAFLSVVYGPGGESRHRSVQLAKWLAGERGLTTLAHLACVGHTARELTGIANRLWAAGVQNILAVRGEAPRGVSQFAATEGELPETANLVQLLRRQHDFCVAVAGYPENHPQRPSAPMELDHLRGKIDAGAQVIVTEFFFDNETCYRFVDRVRGAGIQVPIVATIMPLIDATQAQRVVDERRVTIPDGLLQAIRSAGNPEAVYRLGMEQAISQCRELLAHGAQGLHFYTLNHSNAAADICRALGRSPASPPSQA